MNKNNIGIRGRMRLLIRSQDGRVVAERRADNIVLRQGAGIVARLFSGDAQSKAINQIQVGFGTESATAETTSLKVPPDINLSAVKSPLTPEMFSVVMDKPNIVQVLVSAVFHPTKELKNVTEAGLLADDKLYNQVIFESVTLRVGQDITFFWEIDFPFGH